jgi:hypothetical protein
MTDKEMWSYGYNAGIRECLDYFVEIKIRNKYEEIKKLINQVSIIDKIIDENTKLLIKNIDSMIDSLIFEIVNVITHFDNFVVSPFTYSIQSFDKKIISSEYHEVVIYYSELLDTYIEYFKKYNFLKISD